MSDLIRLLDSGRLEHFIIVGLMIGWAWTAKQWRESEKGRLEDLKAILPLAEGMKNTVATLVSWSKPREGGQ